MDLLSFGNTITISAALVYWLDVLLKSAVVLSIFLLLDKLTRHRLSSQNRHLLWLNALLCLALLPVIQILPEILPSRNTGPEAWFEISIWPGSSAADNSPFSGSWLILLYLLPSTLLLFRLTAALIALYRIRQCSVPVADTSTAELLAGLQARLGVSRRIAVHYSHRIDSPMSFGLLRPMILLPEQAKHWPTPVMTDVLLHELSHVRRLDWISMMLAWVIASLYWLNPLVWVAVRRLHDEAENSCDTAVLHAGRSDTDYAESLLSVAKTCIHSAQPMRSLKLPAQMMLDRNNLKNRIHRILEGNTMTMSDNIRHPVKKSIALMLLVSAAVVISISSTHLVSAQTASTNDTEIRPLNQVTPFYPTRAADEGIEGWVHLRFTVTSVGNVDEHSIEVVEAQPSGIFDASAIRAISQFTFSPRVRDGVSVDVPNVQYVFRYDLKMPEESL